MQIYIQPGTKRPVVFARVTAKGGFGTYLRRRRILEILDQAPNPLTTQQIIQQMGEEWRQDPQLLMRMRQAMSEFHRGLSYPPFVNDVSIRSDVRESSWVITPAGRLALQELKNLERQNKIPGLPSAA